LRPCAGVLGSSNGGGQGGLLGLLLIVALDLTNDLVDQGFEEQTIRVARLFRMHSQIMRVQEKSEAFGERRSVFGER
jgi:hypothetical protein